MKTITQLSILFMALLAWNSALAQCPAGEVEVTITITEDNYGGEITWELTDGGSTVYASGGPYSDGNNGNVNTQTACVPDGATVTFSIYDGYGDGICCAWGEGHYEVTYAGCSVGAEGGEYDDQEITVFTVHSQFAVDLTTTEIDLDDFLLQGNHDVSGSITNLGSDVITSMDLNYQIDNGSVVTENLTGLSIASCDDYTFTHGTQWNANTNGTYTVKVWASNINGGADQYTANDTAETEVTVVDQIAQRIPMVEDFGSSTCPPCASLAQSFDPMLQNNGVNDPNGDITAIKYQMNWPGAGNDPSYNPHGNTRRGYYGINSIPSVWLDGGDYDRTQSTLNQQKSKPSFVELDVTASMAWGGEVSVSVEINPLANFPSNDLRLHIAVTEDHYVFNGNTTGQDEYEQVMRRMLPNASGTSVGPLTSGSTVNVNESYTFQTGNVAQGNYNLWGQSDITVVAFLQDHSTKEIHQSGVAQVAVGYEELTNNVSRLKVYPNPFNNFTNVVMDLRENADVSILVYNMMGELVSAESLGSQQAGRVKYQLDAQNLSAGMYNMVINIGEERMSRKITVSK